MAYIGFDKLSRTEFYNNVSAKDRMQNMDLNQIKNKINDSFEKDEKITTKFEAVSDEDVINNAYPDTKLSEREGHLSLIEENYNEKKLRNDKKSEEQTSVERAVKTTIQILYKKSFF